MLDLISAASDLVWGPFVLIPLLLLTGLYLTLRLRGLQFRQLGAALWTAFVVRREHGADGDISHFQALMTALAATVGTGNIVGVATAIAAFGALAAFGIGNMVQTNSVAEALNESFGVPARITGLVLALAVGAVILGGTRFGVARGIFSNESGLGSEGIAAAAAQTREPARQALVSMTQTFIDTLVVCSFTGVAIVASGAWRSGLDGLMALPNLVGLLLLSGVIARETRDYLPRSRAQWRSARP